jgi:site-specific DNA-methyltransferase (adenine-specific)
MLHLGDCLDILDTLDANSVHAVVTDPPYNLAFMGKHWDRGDIAFRPETWAKMLRVMRPGAYLLAFGGTRTSHRMVVAIEDAGFIVRDTLCWLYGSGFPKSHNVSKALDKAAGAEREVVGTQIVGGNAAYIEGKTHSLYHSTEHAHSAGTTTGHKSIPITAPATPEAAQWDGYGTALKPAYEPIVLTQKPLDGTYAENVLRWGCGALNIDGARIAHGNDVDLSAVQRQQHDNNWGGMARSLMGKDVAMYKPAGRWPANVLLDEQAAAALDEASGTLTSGTGAIKRQSGTGYQAAAYGKESRPAGTPNIEYGDTGGASRYFKVVKVEQGDICGQEKIKGVDTSAGKRTENNADNLSIDGYGSSITGRFRPDTISITKTATCSIMTFPILRAWTGTSIGTCIIESESDIRWLAALSVESVSDANNGSLLITTGDGQQVRIKATVKIVSVLPSRNEESSTENTTTPICESTASGRRFFYVAKASRAEREQGLAPRQKAIHPTVKPLALMRHLLTLVVPSGGVVLDPFAGSGSTLVAAVELGMDWIGIEREPDYHQIAAARILDAELRMDAIQAIPLLTQAGLTL